MHGRALLTSTSEGATAFLDADLRDTTGILTAAAQTLDFGQPIALLLLIILHMVPDSGRPLRHRPHARSGPSVRQPPGGCPSSQRHPRREDGGYDQAGEPADERATGHHARPCRRSPVSSTGLSCPNPAWSSHSSGGPSPARSARPGRRPGAGLRGRPSAPPAAHLPGRFPVSCASPKWPVTWGARHTSR